MRELPTERLNMLDSGELRMEFSREACSLIFWDAVLGISKSFFFSTGWMISSMICDIQSGMNMPLSVELLAATCL